MSNVDEELKQEQRDSDLRWVIELRDKAQASYDKAEHEYQNSGGYGSRGSITKYYNQVKLCELAIKGLNHQCQCCSLRLKNGHTFIKQLQEDKKAGFDNIPIERVISMINAMM